MKYIHICVVKVSKHPRKSTKVLFLKAQVQKFHLNQPLIFRGYIISKPGIIMGHQSKQCTHFSGKWAPQNDQTFVSTFIASKKWCNLMIPVVTPNRRAAPCVPFELGCFWPWATSNSNMHRQDKQVQE